jgi:hypothetical protein
VALPLRQSGSVGISREELVADNPIQIQGRPDRAKLLYRVPDDLDLKHHDLKWPKQVEEQSPKAEYFEDLARYTVFELRAGKQGDMLPPSVHPNTKQPYTWVNDYPATREAIPLLPDSLCELSQNWAKQRDKMEQACPWLATLLVLYPPKPTAADNPQRGAPGSSQDWASFRRDIKAKRSISAQLESMGHTISNEETRCPYPHHRDKKPSCSVYEEQGKFHCHVCDKGGDVIDLYGIAKKIEGPGKTAMALAQELGIALPPKLDAAGADNGGSPGKQGGATAIEWPEEPSDVFMDSTMDSLPELPLHVFPAVLRDFVEDVAPRLGVDPALVAYPALAVCAQAIHDGFKVQVKQKDTEWKEPARIWMMNLHAPSAGWTPALNKAMEPLEAIENSHQAKNKEIAYDNQVAEQLAKQEAEKYAKDKANKVTTANGGGTVDKPRPPERKPLKRNLAQDTTAEAMVVILADNPGGILLKVDEFSSWYDSFGAYNKAQGKDRAFWLKTYDGKPYMNDRKQQLGILVQNMSVCVTTGVQPDAARELFKNYKDDGFLARFMPSMASEHSRAHDEEGNKEALKAYEEAVNRLSAMTPHEGGTVYRLEPAADGVRIMFEDYLLGMEALPEISPKLKRHLGKMQGIFARLLLEWHFLEFLGEHEGGWPAESITGETADRVAEFLTAYAIPHATAFYRDIVGDGDALVHARWIAGHILANNKTALLISDISASYRAFQGKTEEIQATMRVLETLGWVDPVVHRNSRERPRKWLVNPLVHTKFPEMAEKENAERTAKQDRIRTTRAGIEDKAGAA